MKVKVRYPPTTVFEALEKYTYGKDFFQVIERSRDLYIGVFKKKNLRQIGIDCLGIKIYIKRKNPLAELDLEKYFVERYTRDLYVIYFINFAYNLDDAMCPTLMGKDWKVLEFNCNLDYWDFISAAIVLQMIAIDTIKLMELVTTLNKFENDKH